jgi:molecular chaperone DnaJ
MKKDYYSILGITEDEKKLKGEEFEKVLKKKYRKICLENHPDRLGNKSDAEKKAAEEKFKDAAEAYATLSDEKKRTEYDSPFSNFSFSGGFGGMNMDDIFSHFAHDFDDFGGFGFNPFRGARRPQQPNKGTNVNIRLDVTLEDVLKGVEKEIRYSSFVVCDECNGTKKTSDSEEKTCPHCNGMGFSVVTEQRGGVRMQSMTTCQHCNGTGKIITHKCEKCHGTGLTLKTEKCKVKIPKGVSEGSRLVIEGKGNASPDGGARGDLIIEINTQHHEVFERNGADLIFIMEIPVLDAITGCEIEIGTIDGGKILSKIPQGVSDGYQLRFKGYGLPINSNSDMRGNMIGVVRVVMPKKLNENEVNLISELKKQENFNGSNNS